MAEKEARGLDFRPPSGESPRDVQERVKPLLGELAASTIAVTHKGVLRALYAMASAWDMREKPAHRLLANRAHAFTVAAGGTLAIDRLNIPLGRGD
jgi:probable phosphoglycerate mutase